MKQILLILLCSTVIFMGLSIFQEWEAFRPLFSGASESPPPPRCPKEAQQALQSYYTLLPHVYLSGGDIRFLDRLPASDAVKEEIVADLEYLVRNGRYQQMELRRKTIVSENVPAPDACSVQAKEYWFIRYTDLQRAEIQEKPLVLLTSWRYVLRKTPAGWTVVLIEPAVGI